MTERIGFIGLGNMGYEIASRMAEDQRALAVSDISAAAVRRFLAEHESAIEATADDWGSVCAVVLVLPTSAIVEQVLLGQGLLKQLPTDCLIIDMGSSEPLRTRELARKASELGLRLIDAPVSGGVKAALEGRLSVLAGGDDAEVDELRTLVGCAARTVIHVGAVGAGHAAKALNNLVSAGSMSLTLEAIKIGEKFGVAAETMNEVLNSSSGRTNTSENKVRQFMLSGTYASGFSQHLMSKDVSIAVTLADDLGAPAEVSKAVQEQWRAVAQLVDPTTDHTAMHQYVSTGE